MPHVDPQTDRPRVGMGPTRAWPIRGLTLGFKAFDQFLHPDPEIPSRERPRFLLRPSITTAVITSRASDMAHLQDQEGANYVPGNLLTMSCNQSPLAPPRLIWL